MVKVRILAVSVLVLGIFAGYFNLAPFLNPLGFFSRFPFRLGLDLQGGTHLVYRADTSSLKTSEVKEAMASLRDVIERRINIFGIAEPVVQIEEGSGEERLIVELAGIKDINQAIRMIGETPFLEFRKPVFEKPASLSGEAASPKAEESVTFEPAGLTGRYLKKAVLEFNQTTFEPLVLLEFNEEGRELFSRLTKDYIGKPIAIFLDGEPISIPIVREEIDSGRAQISGDFTPEEARTLVRRLNSGALPVFIELVSQESVGASLGAEALQKGTRAGFFGILAVMFFLIFWYRLPGFLGALALAIYVGILLMIFKLIPVTLTAAGIAGFILSAGMAVDANVLIFERFKEEFRSGKLLETSIREGFSRAWTSIRDSNVSSLITSAILYWFGTSLVRGFALTLGLGILVSMFSAITVTRIFLLALGFKKEGKMVRLLFGSGVR